MVAKYHIHDVTKQSVTYLLHYDVTCVVKLLNEDDDSDIIEKQQKIMYNLIRSELFHSYKQVVKAIMCYYIDRCMMCNIFYVAQVCITNVTRLNGHGSSSSSNMWPSILPHEYGGQKPTLCCEMDSLHMLFGQPILQVHY